jgi:polyphosphate kinase 2 (PPK2 family)
LDYQKKFRVKPGEKLRLKKLDPSFTGEHESEAIAKEATEHSRAKLAHEQNLLYAEHKHSVLIVLQAMDAGGKDGTIKHVFSGLNPQGVHVASFKQPTAPEVAHDFLWRVHPHAPGRGEIAIFNRSHYEDVLVTRVHKLIDKATWTRRYQRDLRLRGPAGPERNHDPQILPPYQQGRAARAFRSAPRGSRPQLEDQRG